MVGRISVLEIWCAAALLCWCGSIYRRDTREAWSERRGARDVERETWLDELDAECGPRSKLTVDERRAGPGFETDREGGGLD